MVLATCLKSCLVPEWLEWLGAACTSLSLCGLPSIMNLAQASLHTGWIKTGKMEAAWALEAKALELTDHHLYTVGQSKSQGQAEIQEEGR